MTPYLLEGSNARDQIYSRFLKMLEKMENSENGGVQFLARMCSRSQRCISGSNLMVIARRLDTDVRSVRSEGRKILQGAYVAECSEQDCAMIGFIREMRGVLWGQSMVHGFTADEINCILNYVCEN